MKKIFLLALVSIFIGRAGIAQTTGQNIQNPMQGYEDSLKFWGHKFINDEDELERINANHTFIKTLVKALKTPNSFQYPFDSVKTVSILNSPDNRFRIFSWPIAYNDGSYRFYGAIQINTGGSLKLFPLNDDSFSFFNPQDTISDNMKWYGAEYYRVIQVYSPQPKLKDQKDTYGPDLSYDGFKLRDGRWQFVENLDMRNIPENRDNQYIDPKKQAQADKKY